MKHMHVIHKYRKILLLDINLTMTHVHTVHASCRITQSC